MLYTGNTLREALGKALGTRDEYGRPLQGRFKQLAATLSDDSTNPNTTPEAIRRAREDAVRLTMSEIRGSQYTVRPGRDEIGLITIYHTTDGRIEILPPERSGNPAKDSDGVARKWKFHFEPYISDESVIIMCSAHTHPRESTHGLPPGATRSTDRLNTIQRADSGSSNLNLKDQRLLTHGPVVIKNPNASVVDVWGDWKNRGV